MTFNGFCLMAYLSHLRAAFTDPGVIPEGMVAPFVSEYGENKDCEKCLGKPTWKPVRAHHCAECGLCIFKMDHHCPWINNCVGHRNMKYFLQFVFYIMLASGMLSLLCMLSFYNLLTSSNTRLHMNHSVSILCQHANLISILCTELPLCFHWKHPCVRGGPALRIFHIRFAFRADHIDRR